MIHLSAHVSAAFVGRARSATLAALAALVLLGGGGALLSMFAAPALPGNVTLPWGIIARSQAELMAQRGGGRIRFVGATTTRSALSTYQAAFAHLKPGQAAVMPGHRLVWVVEVRGLGQFQAPLPDAAPAPPHLYTYIMVVDLWGRLLLELGR